MSEENKEKQPVKDETDTKDVLEISVAQTIAERDIAIEKLSDALDEIEKLKKELKAAKDLIEEDTKAGLIKDIAERSTLSKGVLSEMSVDKLVELKKAYDTAKIPAFKSGTPLMVDKKVNMQQELDSMYESTLKEIRGGNK